MKKQDPSTPAQKVEKNRKHTVSTYLKCIPPVPGQTQKEYDSTGKEKHLILKEQKEFLYVIQKRILLSKHE